MTTTENPDEYNGWTNRETWAFMLHVNNDQGLQQDALATAGETVAKHGDPGNWDIGEAVVEFFQDMIAEFAPGDTPEGLRTMDQEVGSWWRVDRCEVGASFREDLNERDENACPACHEPIDYCQGHGAIGDPAGAAILAAELDS